MYVVLTDKEDKPTEEETPLIILPRISQSYTRRSIGYCPETPITAVEVNQRDKSDEDLNLPQKEEQRKEM